MFSLPLSPDLTLTVASVTAVLESVGNWDGLGLLLGVPQPVLGVIRRSHHGDKECKAAFSEHFVNSVPGASWNTLAGSLYYCEERKALQAVGKHLKEGKGLCGLCGNINIAHCVYSMFMYRCLNACWQLLFLIHVPVIISVMDVHTLITILVRRLFVCRYDYARVRSAWRFRFDTGTAWSGGQVEFALLSCLCPSREDPESAASQNSLVCLVRSALQLRRSLPLYICPPTIRVAIATIFSPRVTSGGWALTSTYIHTQHKNRSTVYMYM